MGDACMHMVQVHSGCMHVHACACVHARMHSHAPAADHRPRLVIDNVATEAALDATRLEDAEIAIWRLDPHPQPRVWHVCLVAEWVS